MCTDGIAPFRRLPPAALSTAQWNSFSQRAWVSHVVLFHLRLTTPGFRQRADRERTFTASAPPGMRPPPSRRSGADDDATADSIVGRDLGANLGREPHSHAEREMEVEVEMEMEMDRAQPRRDAIGSGLGLGLD